jgi:hypothetical protein
MSASAAAAAGGQSAAASAGDNEHISETRRVHRQSPRRRERVNVISLINVTVGAVTHERGFGCACCVFNNRSTWGRRTCIFNLYPYATIVSH